MDATQTDASDSDPEIISSQEGNPKNEVDCIKKIKRITNKMVSMEINPETIGSSSKEVSNLLRESNKLALNAYTGSAAALYDTDLMAATGRTVSKLTQALEIDSRFFQHKSFTNSFKKFLNQSINSPVTKTQWAKFSTEHAEPIIHSKSAPIIQYTFGSLNLDSEVNASQSASASDKVAYSGRPAAKKPRTKLTISGIRQSAELINAANSNDRVEKDRTVIEVENLHDRLSCLSESLDGAPVPYLSLIVNKADFGKTVENAFHLSFLIKEGFAEIRVVKVNGQKLTVVRCVPTEEREKSDRQRSSAQVACTLTEKMWRQWCVKVDREPYLM